MWLDVVSCSTSEYDVPAGENTRTRDWTATTSGRLVHIHGHLHHGGRTIKATNLRTGSAMCQVNVVSGGTPEYIDRYGNREISSAPPCTADPVATFRTGDRIQVAATYIADHSHDHVMGIKLGWFAS